jgi:hypothetical protein
MSDVNDHEAESIRLWQAAWDDLSWRSDYASRLARGSLVASVTWPGTLYDHVQRVINADNAAAH